ncbi:DUF4309 domain-containing protein [Anaerobacillus sp. HL2]|nr:DUF4309 domain-containing protein [Anaerobacillus sp. HL2]
MSYHDLTLDKNFLIEAKKGKCYFSDQIGMSKEQLISLVGEPTVIDWYSGGHYYYYNEIAYILDESLTIVAINMPGQRINEQISTVLTFFGTPSSESYSEMDNNYIYSYHLNEYTLSFEAFNKDEEVINIWVTKNKK